MSHTVIIFPQIFWLTINQFGTFVRFSLKILVAELSGVFGSFVVPGSNKSTRGCGTSGFYWIGASEVGTKKLNFIIIFEN